MRYAIFTDIHANLEALEAVLAKIDQLAEEEPIDQIWFLGDLVGYGPNPNECIDKLRERTDVMIAGNHDWAAVGKIDLEDFSEAARISAEWTAKQLTEEHRTFLSNLPQRLEIDECTLVHGSPYGPLWEYLTSEVLAERSFQHFSTRFCVVGHTHVPIIFQQPDVIANSPTAPLDLHLKDEAEEEALEEDIIEEDTEVLASEDPPEEDTEVLVKEDIPEALPAVEVEVAEETEGSEEAEEVAVETQEQASENDVEEQTSDDIDELAETEKVPVVQYASRIAAQSDKVYAELGSLEEIVTEAAEVVAEVQYQMADDIPDTEIADPTDAEVVADKAELVEPAEQDADPAPDETHADPETNADQEETSTEVTSSETISPEETIQDAEERLNAEIEELLSLLGLSQSMINITNEMILPPEGNWQALKGYRAIINPGGVGQPRDGDPRAAFMIYDTERGFTFYRVAYPFERTQEKIIEAKLPQHLATRLAYGR
jgi:diadenosine tetraphosphatase ApaH/serine/threonine PP2A family protein phosphatase